MKNYYNIGFFLKKKICFYFNKTLLCHITIIVKHKLKMFPDIPSFLITQNQVTRARGQSLLASLTIIDPLQIINNFPSYFPYFHELLKSRASIPIDYALANSFLVNTLNGIHTAVDSVNAIPILTYICDCLEEPPATNVIDSFSTYIYEDTHLYHAAVHLLSKSIKESLCEVTLRLLSITDSHKVTKSLRKILRKQVPVLQKLLISGKPEIITYFARCISTVDRKLALFAASILIFALHESPSLIPEFIPYIVTVQYWMLNFKESHKNKVNDFKEIYRILTFYIYEKKLKLPEAQPCSALLSPIYCQDALFANVTPKSLAAIISKPPPVVDQQQSISSSTRTNMGLLTRLDVKMNENASLQVKTSSMSNFSKEEQSKTLMPIMAFKLGGFNHGQWQSRCFEYFPANKALVWHQKEKTKGEVKGVIIIDNSITVEKQEKANESTKGRGNVLILKTKKKDHLITFQTKEILDKWYTVLSEATATPKKH